MGQKVVALQVGN